MSEKITCIIVDDEKTSRDGLRALVENDIDIDVVEVCGGGIEAIESLDEFKPDLLLLDIQMPDINGFEVLQNSRHKPEVIFITAYDEFALKAFEYHALDYLLKPFTDKRFKEAIERAKQRIQAKEFSDEKLRSLSASYTKSGEKNNSVWFTNNKGIERLVIKSDGDIHFLPIQSIRWIEAFDYYIKIHCIENIYLVRETMKKIHSLLPGETFFRIHKSSIINLNFISKIESGGNNETYVLMENGENLKVSRTYKNDLIAHFS